MLNLGQLSLILASKQDILHYMISMLVILEASILDSLKKSYILPLILRLNPL